MGRGVWGRVLDEYTLPPDQGFTTPGQLAAHIYPRTVHTPALDLIDQALVTATRSPDSRLIISMPPQEGKSQRISRFFPTWRLIQNPKTRIGIASYESRVARRLSRAIRDDIITTPTLGLTIRKDVAAQGEWLLTPPQGEPGSESGGVIATGIGGALTGRALDLLIIDDPIKGRDQADSLIYRQRAWDWWREVGATRLSPGAGVVVVMTRWHHDDLVGRLTTAEDGHIWTVLNIQAQADTPDDPLGRAPGQYMLSARGRTPQQWDAIRIRSGARTWAALYQGHPSPAEGGIINPAWWRYYTTPPPLDGPLIQSWDLAFKDTTSSDYVVGQVWLHRGADAYLLDQVRGRWGFSDTCRQIQALTERWPQTTLKLVEDKANGPAVLDALHHRVPGLVPVTPHGGKVVRAHAVTPLIEAGNVYLPHPSTHPWVADLVEEATAFPNGSHDDQIDALTQALARLLVPDRPRGGYGTSFYDIG